MRQNEEHFTQFLVSCPESEVAIDPNTATQQETELARRKAKKAFIAYCTKMSHVSLGSPVQVICKTLYRGVGVTMIVFTVTMLTAQGVNY